VIHSSGLERLVCIIKSIGESGILANVTLYIRSGLVTKILRGRRGVLSFVANVFREGL
jgi:hypothetical protein